MSKRFWPTPRVIALRILFDHNVPVGVRAFLKKHDVCTVVEMSWPPQMENGDLLDAAEAAGFDVFVTSDQNIRHQQNPKGRRFALIILGSNVWPIVRKYGTDIATQIDKAVRGTLVFIEMPLPKPSNR